VELCFGSQFAEKLKTVNDVNVRLKAELQTYQSQLGKLQTELNSKQDELDDVNAQRDIANDTLRDVVQEKEKLFKELKVPAPCRSYSVCVLAYSDICEDLRSWV
jgi:Skp family chaperone for outer membrane proteins